MEKAKEDGVLKPETATDISIATGIILTYLTSAIGKYGETGEPDKFWERWSAIPGSLGGFSDSVLAFQRIFLKITGKRIWHLNSVHLMPQVLWRVPWLSPSPGAQISFFPLLHGMHYAIRP